MKTNHTSLLLEQSYLNGLLGKRLDCSLGLHGISFTEFTIMYRLHHAEAGTMSRIQLAERVGLTASGVTRLLAPMEKNNIVLKTANPRDARQSLVSLSDTGEQLFQDAATTVEHTAEAVFSLFDEEDFELFQKLLNKIKY